MGMVKGNLYGICFACQSATITVSTLFCFVLYLNIEGEKSKGVKKKKKKKKRGTEQELVCVWKSRMLKIF
jgi:hypothetical protein